MLVRLGFDDVKVALRDVGIILKWSAITFLAPIIISLVYRESVNIIAVYILVALFSFFLGAVIKRLFRTETETDLKHAFITVSIVWLVYTAIAAFPFVLIHGMSFLDGFFESMSTLTTTGLTVMWHSIDSAPKSLIFWRSILSWIGGVGIIVLALIGILATYTKSAKLMTAEGREERIKPNLKNTVKEIWSVYILLTLVGVVLLYFSGMGLFEAVNYSMSAISTTGMDISSQGLIGLHNYWIDLSLIVIMIIGATAFSVHYLFIKKKKIDIYFQDLEFRIMIILVLISSIAIIPMLIKFYGNNVLAGIEYGFFHAISSLTCGGFALVPVRDVFNWGDFVKLALIAVMFIGGSAGSTAGGIKISRFWLFLKSIYWRIKEAILPKDSFFQRRFEDRIVQPREVKEISQFILLYVVFILIGAVVLTFQGNDLGNSLFEVVSAQSNAGISTGITYSGMPLATEVMLIINMWVGRLEIVPILAAVGFALSVKKWRKE